MGEDGFASTEVLSNGSDNAGELWPGPTWISRTLLCVDRPSVLTCPPVWPRNQGVVLRTTRDWFLMIQQLSPAHVVSSSATVKVA